MDHIVIPLSGDHLRALEILAGGAADAAGVLHTPADRRPHVTLLAYTGLDRSAARRVVAAVAAATRPFSLHAHGYGFFTGDQPSDLSLHVPVVRSAVIDEVHRRLWAELTRAGAVVANWCTPELWTPHITLLDRSLGPARLGAAAAWLARRHHPSWRIPVDRLSLTGGWPEHDRPADVVLLGGTAALAWPPRVSGGTEREPMVATPCRSLLVAPTQGSRCPGRPGRAGGGPGR